VVSVPRAAAAEEEGSAPAIVTPPVPSGAGFDLSDRVTLLPGATPAPLLSPPRVIERAAAPGALSDTGSSTDTGSHTGTATGAAASGGAGPVPSDVAGGVVGGETGAELMLIFDTGQREQLPAPIAIVLGRAPEAVEPGDRTIAVRDPEHTVSKSHARLEHSYSGTWITDRGSTNGTSLLDETGGSRRLAPGVRTLVEDGVRVQLGDRVFTISRLLGGSS
jgi:hypothetical protein